MPVILWQLWRFITPGLHTNEKQYALPFVARVDRPVRPRRRRRLLDVPAGARVPQSVGGRNNFTAVLQPDEYLQPDRLLMIVAFGIGFEFPVVLVVLELAGVVTSAQLRTWRRRPIVIIVIFAAVITPSHDPISLLAMAHPDVIFYEVSIVIGRILKT